jgi:hypothetical protein
MSIGVVKDHYLKEKPLLLTEISIQQKLQKLIVLDLANLGKIQYLLRKKEEPTELCTMAVAYSSYFVTYFMKNPFEPLPIAVRDQTADMPDMTEKTPYICKQYNN